LRSLPACGGFGMTWGARGGTGGARCGGRVVGRGGCRRAHSGAPLRRETVPKPFGPGWRPLRGLATGGQASALDADGWERNDLGTTKSRRAQRGDGKGSAGARMASAASYRSNEPVLPGTVPKPFGPGWRPLRGLATGGRRNARPTGRPGDRPGVCPTRNGRRGHVRLAHSEHLCYTPPRW
jgi:hypothetical protein